MTPEAVDQYVTNGTPIKQLARDAGVADRTLRDFLTHTGIQIRPQGRPPGGHAGQGHRGPKLGVHPAKPRYSCTHERQKGHNRCPVCDRCQCAPEKRRPVRPYPGGWLCRCGRQIAP